MARGQQRMRVDACPRARARPLLGLIFGLIVATGCHRQVCYDWQALLGSDNAHIVFCSTHEAADYFADALTQAEQSFTEAARLDRQNCDSCVDWYFRAAGQSWPLLEVYGPTPTEPAADNSWRIYQQSVAQLIESGYRHGRLDPRGSLVVKEGGTRRVVPITYHGFPLPPHEFCQLRRADAVPRGDIKRYYDSAGLGSSLVAIRQTCDEQPFFPRKQHFAVTAVLRPTTGDGAELAFYNPRVFDSLSVGSTPMPLRRDLSAPFAAILQDTPRKYTEGFIDPNDANVQPRLFMLEPYQPGKIPIVMIHGLWSDPVTWTEAINDLQAQTDLQQAYQFWLFRYPTGRGILESAAELRDELAKSRKKFDPRCEDKALDQIVLVGHSMGGIVAELQVTYSEDQLWQAVASQPLSAVRAPPQMLARLQRMFFFDPSPQVTCMVCIGTPNRGSNVSRRVVGRAASKLVQSSPAEAAVYHQLMDNNRDIFAEFLWEKWPTSVDLLEPDNPMLHAAVSMRRNPCVQRHTIIGTGGMPLGGEPSDGMVPVSSARQAGVKSETFVATTHPKLHSDIDAVNQLAHILRDHARRVSTP